MRQLFLEDSMIALKEVCQPALDDNSVLVSVHYSCLSPAIESAILALTERGFSLSSLPEKVNRILAAFVASSIEENITYDKHAQDTILPLGYACAGQVIAIGKNVTKFRTGDLVACAGAGKANHADIICVPEHQAAFVSDKKFLKVASSSAIGAIALHAVRRSHAKIGEIVCVFGLDLLGQITVQLAKLSGSMVIGIDSNENNRKIAITSGANYVFDPHDTVLMDAIEMITHSAGVDATIITVATDQHFFLNQAMDLTRQRGRMVVIGDINTDCSANKLYHKEIDVIIAHTYYPDAMHNEQADQPGRVACNHWTQQRNLQAFTTLLEQGAIDIDPFLLDKANMKDVETIYTQINKQKKLGAFLAYTPKAKPAGEKPKLSTNSKDASGELTFIPAVKNELRIGMIGAGAFAKETLLPIVSSIKNAQLNAVVDANIATSLNVSKKYGAARALSSDHELFTQDIVDAVVIASPHNEHCDQALNALSHGKAAFVAKPMVTDFEQLARMKAFLTEHPQAPLCVGYNRSFAPFMQQIKSRLEGRATPIMVQYRINARTRLKDHWQQSGKGAGNIIGDACHILDLFYYLADSEPVAVSVESLRHMGEQIFPTDNFSAQISFADSSICTLLYTSVGHKTDDQERMELYFDGKSIVMDNYKTLTGFGLSPSFNQKTTKPDKGHEALIKRFFSTVQKGEFEAPISHERLYSVAKLTLIIDQLAIQGGGFQQLKENA
ncbi:MAG: bi-domain-containing oxidoreductase [Candidatus Babeliales bacterium]